MYVYICVDLRVCICVGVCCECVYVILLCACNII